MWTFNVLNPPLSIYSSLYLSCTHRYLYLSFSLSLSPSLSVSLSRSLSPSLSLPPLSLPISLSRYTRILFRHSLNGHTCRSVDNSLSYQPRYRALYLSPACIFLLLSISFCWHLTSILSFLFSKISKIRQSKKLAPSRNVTHGSFRDKLNKKIPSCASVKTVKIGGSYWLSIGQRVCLLQHQSKFESCWRRNFLRVECRYKFLWHRLWDKTSVTRWCNKSCPIFPNIVKKVAKSHFINKLYYLK